MAKFIPSMESIICNYFEHPTASMLSLLISLQNLSDDYQIYYRPPIGYANPDIVIVHKTGGVLIIEINDWVLSDYQFCAGNKIQEDYVIHQDEQHRLMSPFCQARDYKEEINDLLSSTYISEIIKSNGQFINDTKVYSIIRSSVLFFNANQSDVEEFFGASGLLINEKEYRVFRNYNYCWCREDLADLAKRIEQLIGRTLPFFTETIYQEILNCLSCTKEWQIQSKPFDLEELNDVQKELIKPNLNGRTRVKGVAGSGKTLVIVLKAINCYKTYRKPVLILTYNISICNYIRDLIASQTVEMPPRQREKAFEVIHYDGFIPQVLKKIGIKGPSPNEFENLMGEIDWEQYHRYTDNLIRENKGLLAKYDCQYRTVLIDEAQDFEKEWFALVEDCFVQTGGDFLIMADQEQNIYMRQSFIAKLPVVPGFSGPWKTLKKSYRLSSEALLLARDFRDKNMQEYVDNEISGISKENNGIVKYYDLSSISQDKYKKIWEIIKKLNKEENFELNDFCILFSEIKHIRSFEYTVRTCTDSRVRFIMTCETEEEWKWIEQCYRNDRRLKNKNIKKFRNSRKHDFRLKAGTIALSTIHSFKGWEISTIVIVLDDNPRILKEHVYTALTRAQSNIIVINLGGNKYGQYFSEYVEKMKNRLPIPEGYEISDKPTNIIFSTQHGICQIIEKISKGGIKVEDEEGHRFSIILEHYRIRNQACYVKKTVKL